MEPLDGRLRQLGGVLQQRVGAQRELKGEIVQAGAEAIDKKVEAGRLAECVDLLAAIYDTHRDQFERDIGSVVSRGLSDVFGEELTLLVEMGQSADLPTVKFSIRDSRGLETGILDARGGGVVNIVSLLLQVRTLTAIQPPQARLLVLDEPFTAVNEALYPRLARLLQRIIDEGGFQIILITQNGRLADALADGGITLTFEQHDGVTQYRQVATTIPTTQPV